MEPHSLRYVTPSQEEVAETGKEEAVDQCDDKGMYGIYPAAGRERIYR
jgi:hypothetical protein